MTASVATASAETELTWRDRVDSVEPIVLVLGGFLASPPLYRRMRDLLLERGAADVLVAGIWTPDWLLSTVRGQGPIATRAGRWLLRASAASAESPLSRGAPVLVVGHSAGGVVARVLTSPDPFEGRRLDGTSRIGAIVTLGSPHLVDGSGMSARRSGELSRFLAEHAPGAFRAPGVGYLTVGSTAVVGRPDGDGRERAAYRGYRGLVEVPDGEPIPGDGLIPLASALLPGAPQLVFDDAFHWMPGDGSWYGDAVHLDAWWPLAVATWRDALRARMAGQEGPRAPSAPTRGHPAPHEATLVV